MQEQDASTPSAAEALAHERALIQAFVVKERKERLLGLLDGASRQKLPALLHHFKCLDNRFAKPLPTGVHSPVQIAALLRARGAPRNCLVITSLRDLDQRMMPLVEGLNEIVGSGCGSLISCVPGQLAYFEGEEPGDRYILERAKAQSVRA